MEQSSLVKWVDELQGQIDALKRDIASIPAPEPIPEPDAIVFSCGHASLTVTDTPIEESNNNEFTRVAEYEFEETFDPDTYDYYINFDFFSVDLTSALAYYATTNCMSLHDDTPLQEDVMPVLSSEQLLGVETCAVAGTVNVNFQYDESGVTLSIISEYGDGKCIAGAETGTSTIDYMIIAKKKAEPSTKKRKSKNRR